MCTVPCTDDDTAFKLENDKAIYGNMKMHIMNILLTNLRRKSHDIHICLRVAAI